MPHSLPPGDGGLCGRMKVYEGLDYSVRSQGVKNERFLPEGRVKTPETMVNFPIYLPQTSH